VSVCLEGAGGNRRALKFVYLASHQEYGVEFAGEKLNIKIV